MIDEDTKAEIALVIGQATGLPLPDAAYAIWRRRYRLNTLEGRPTPEEVMAFRAMSPAEQAAAMRRDRDFAQDGPTFGYLKSVCPHATDDEIKQAIITAVRFESDCFKYFANNDTDYWQQCVYAVARAAKESPVFLEETYQQARNDVAYYYK